MNAINKSTLIFSWTVILIASPLAIICWRTLATHEPFWWSWIHFGALLILLSLTFFKSVLRPLRRFAAIVVVIFLMGYGGGWDWGLIPFIRSSEAWSLWITQSPKAISEIMLHLLRLSPALIILSFLLLTGRKRKDFYLIKGDTRAAIEKSRILGIKKPEPWIKIALIFSAVFATVTTLFLIAVNGFSLETFALNWFLIPIGLLIAAMNAFNEEFTLRAAPLGEIEPVIGKTNSLLVTATYFGLGHYFGVPSGVLGVLLSGFLGWFLGKSMIETKGFFVAWLVHFITDIPIFLFFIAGGI
jgi:membrane protease YdiL (CAAX protease family)